MLADIGKNRIVNKRPALVLFGFVRRGDTRGVNRFIEVRHLDEFVTHVACSLSPIHFSNTGCGADHDVTKPCFTDVTGAVVGGEPRHQFLSKFVLTIHENVRPRNEYVVEDHECFLTAVLRITLVNVAHFKRTGVTGLSPINVGKARCGCWNHANNRVVFIRLEHIHGGHDAYPV